MAIKRITLKVANMRKAQDFVVYPESDSHTTCYKLQSDSRMAFVDKICGKGAITIKGSHFADFNNPDNRLPFEVDQATLAEIASCQPKSGDRIGGCVFIA